jgi:hypothetical protein
MSFDGQLRGGNAGGAFRVGDTVRRRWGPWTPSVHGLLSYLAQAGFTAAPRPAGIDEHGREILSFLPGLTVGDELPWPAWVHSDHALVQVAHWLREYHEVVARYVPASDAVWREGGSWRPGMLIGHNDAAPYNAAWQDDHLVGFFDWDFAGPVTKEWDLAFTAFAWVPLHARHVVEREGFREFDDRARRLLLFLDSYGWTGSPTGLIRTMQKRVAASSAGIVRAAAAGDLVFQRMIERGIDADLRTAVEELDSFRTGVS